MIYRLVFILYFFLLWGAFAQKSEASEAWSGQLRQRWEALPGFWAQGRIHHYGAGAAALGLLAYTLHEDEVWAAQARNSALSVPQWTADISGEIQWVAPALVASYALARVTDWSAGRRWTPVIMESVIIAGGISYAGKWLSGRARPAEGSAAFAVPGGRGFDAAFPSGHATVSFALAASLARALQDRWYYALPLYSLAGLGAWQRIQSGAHWPADVLAGAIIGFTVGRIWSGSEVWAGRTSMGLSSWGDQALLRFTYQWPLASAQNRHAAGRVVLH